MSNLHSFLLFSTLLSFSNAVATTTQINFLAPDLKEDPVGNGTIDVHLVPHPHNDAGWLYTTESYLKGNSKGCVSYILDGVVDSLQQEPNRRFVYVEQQNFTTWWQNQSEEKKKIVRELVQDDRIEFINGGYVMNDKGCTYYDDIIGQMTLRHRLIKAQFNQTVQSAWHIDTFGHSAAQARLANEIGLILCSLRE